MNNNSQVLDLGDWVVRRRLPHAQKSPRVIVLLHGWTGDENSMWIFTPRLPDKYLILAPRGLTKTPVGGFGWQNDGVAGWPRASDFTEASEELFDLVDSLKPLGVKSNRFDVMGFSQGAALAYTMLLQNPERIGKLAGLSGFLPEGLGEEIANRKLENKQIFMAHGTRDDMVSLDRARLAVEDLKSAGAEVIYCEEDVGHKLSAGCFRAMDDYFV